MRLTRRSVLAAAVAAVVPGPTRAAGPALDLFDFFRGRGQGSGVFESDLFEVRRPFTVATHGTVSGRTLTLREDIAYADGAREQAVWRFDRATWGGYVGRRTGVDGPVPIHVDAGIVRMGYVATVTGPDGRPIALRFDDVLERTGRDTVLNTARVSVLGITVGRVRVDFTR